MNFEKVNMKYDFIIELKKFTEKASLNQYLERVLEKYSERKNGKTYSFSEHLRAVIYSLLSNQRPWKRIEENKNNIDNIFFNYDVIKIKNADPEYFVKSLKEINCGNRSIKKQMDGLKDIISVLENISKTHGTIDKYYNDQITKTGNPYFLAKELADKNNRYKLKNMGIALACEYLKNIGIDIAKPDTHIRRMLGKPYLGFSSNKEATPGEAVKFIKEIAENNNITQIEVDNLLWLYCSDGYGEVCTKDNPKCFKCVIKKFCNSGRTDAV